MTIDEIWKRLNLWWLRIFRLEKKRKNRLCTLLLIKISFLVFLCFFFLLECVCAASLNSRCLNSFFFHLLDHLSVKCTVQFSDFLTLQSLSSMLLSFKRCIFVFLLWFLFFTLERYLAKRKSSSLFFWLSQLCLWLFVHIHEFLHTPTQENYHPAMIWLNFQRLFAIKGDGVNPAIFHCICLNYIKVFFSFTFLSTLY